jgi:hypothetical protein
MNKSDKDVLDILKRFKAELRGIDFDDVKKQQKYGRLRGYIDALMKLLEY